MNHPIRICIFVYNYTIIINKPVSIVNTVTRFFLQTRESFKCFLHRGNGAYSEQCPSIEVHQSNDDGLIKLLKKDHLRMHARKYVTISKGTKDNFLRVNNTKEQ